MLDITYIILGVLLGPCLIFGIYAQIKAQSTFSRYSAVNAKANLSGEDATKQMLVSTGLTDVKIGSVSGSLTDNYNPNAKVVSLSDSTRKNLSVASLGVIAHEIGHAQQQKDNYKPFMVRKAIVPIVNFGSIAYIFLMIIGLLLTLFISTSPIGIILLWASVILYFLSTVFYAVTLSVERDASKRALVILQNSGLVENEDIPCAKEVLKAAELTYIAALVTSLLYFLRFFIMLLPILTKKD